MNTICSILLLLFLTVFTQAQTKNITAGGIEIQVSSVDMSLNAVFCQVGIMPEFPGGMDNLIAFAKRKIKYPKTAIKDNVQGSVMLQFIVNEKGKVTDTKIT